MSITTQDIQKYVATIKKSIQMGKVLAAFTPTDIDDKTLETTEKVLLALEPYVTEPWVADLVNFALRFWDKNGEEPVKVIAALRSIATSIQE